MYILKYYGIDLPRSNCFVVPGTSIDLYYEFGEPIIKTVEKLVKASGFGYFCFAGPEFQFLVARVAKALMNNQVRTVSDIYMCLLCLRVLGVSMNHSFFKFFENSRVFSNEFQMVFLNY